MADPQFGFCRIDTTAFTPSDSPWGAPPPDLPLVDSEIHVFSIALDLPPSRVAELEPLLSRDELTRARRYKVPRDGQRFIVARASLRTLLGAYRHIDPACVQLSYGTFGKPFMADATKGDRMQFNMSGSHGLGIIAVRLDDAVGVDVEAIRPFPGALQIAERFFAEDEYRELRAMPESERLQGFFEYWTRKEAIVKSLGLGLSYSLDSFSVSLEPSASVGLGDRQHERDTACRRSVYALKPRPGYVAALAT